MSKSLFLGLIAISCAALFGCSSESSPKATTPVSETQTLEKSNALYTMSAVDGDSDGLDNALVDAKGGAPLKEMDIKNLEALLKKLAKEEDLNNALGLSSRIADFGKEAFDHIEKAKANTKGVAEVALLRALYTTSRNNKQLDDAIRSLGAIAGGKSEREVRVAAAEMLEHLASPRHSKILEGALAGSFDTPVKIALCVALWNSAKDKKAIAILEDLLKAESRNTQLQAAIGLAKVGKFDTAKAYLRILANQPNMNGMTAKALLERERLQRRLMNKIFEEPKEGEVEVDLTLLEHLIDMIGERYIYQNKVGRTRLKEKAAEGLLSGLDPYCVYLDESQAKRAESVRSFAIPTLGVTIGAASLSEDSANREKRAFQVATIVAVQDGSPADLAGLMPGDRIVNAAPGKDFKRIQEWRAGAATGHEETVLDFLSLPLDDTIDKLSAEAGGKLALLISRKAWSLSRWVALEHAEPVAPKNELKSLEGGFAFARIRTFDSSTPKFFNEVMASLKKLDGKAPAKGLLIDLRSCSGGSVAAAAKCAEMLLAANLRVTYSFGRHSKVAPKRSVLADSEDRDVFTPVTVLVDGGTADAGEIFAAALQDHERAQLVGAQTFGRAMIQKVFSLAAKDSKHALLLTVGAYYTPKGEARINYRGLTPNLVVEDQGEEGWVLDELEILRPTKSVERYLADKAFTPELLAKLALGDGESSAAYPKFAEFAKSVRATKIKGHEIHLEDAHLRREVRREIRKAIAAVSGKALEDLQGDKAFMSGLGVLAKEAKVDLEKIPHYAPFLPKAKK